MPLVLPQHFRGNLDNWDPALIDALASTRRVVTFDNAGVGGSTGTTPDSIEQMARDAIAFLAAMEFSQVDLLGFSIGSFIAQQMELMRPAIVRRLVLASAAPQARPACMAGRLRSSARSARRKPVRRPTLRCSSPGRPQAGKLARKHCSASTPGPRTGTRQRPGRPARHNTTRSAPGGSPIMRCWSGCGHRRAGVGGQRRQRPDDPASLLVPARGPAPARWPEWATDALDQVRREVWRAARKAGQTAVADDLKGCLVRAVEEPGGPDRTPTAAAGRHPADQRPLDRAYPLNEQPRCALRRPVHQAMNLLLGWLQWARRSRLEPFVDLARTIDNHWDQIAASLQHGLSNARVESLNTKIRLITRRSFGFHSPEAVIALAMLSLGGLCPPLPGRG